MFGIVCAVLALWQLFGSYRFSAIDLQLVPNVSTASVLLLLITLACQLLGGYSSLAAVWHVCCCFSSRAILGSVSGYVFFGRMFLGHFGPYNMECKSFGPYRSKPSIRSCRISRAPLS